MPHNQTSTRLYSGQKNTRPDTRTPLTRALSGLHNGPHGFWRALPDNNGTKKARQRNKEAKMSNLNKQTKKQHKRTDDGWGALMTQS